MCSETLNEGYSPSQLARGFAWSIGAMPLVPMLLVDGGALGVWRAVQCQKNRGEDELSPELSD